MELNNFRNDFAKLLWDLFEATGDPKIFCLYSRVQDSHGYFQKQENEILNGIGK